MAQRQTTLQARVPFRSRCRAGGECALSLRERFPRTCARRVPLNGAPVSDPARLSIDQSPTRRVGDRRSDSWGGNGLAQGDLHTYLIRGYARPCEEWAIWSDV